MTSMAEAGPGWEIRLGRHEDVLADVKTCDAVITDPPYGARIHAGHDHEARESTIGYEALTPGAAEGFAFRWGRAASSWFCAMTSHDLVPSYERGLGLCGRLTFAPVPILQHRPRLTGDGPGSGAVHMVVSRPREARFMGWGSLPCWYLSSPERGAAVVGAKPLALMRAIIRDYTRPGDLVVDPCAGGGTTLLAAVMEGRQALGAEVNPATFEAAVARLRRGYTPDLFASVQEDDVAAPSQGDMFA